MSRLFLSLSLALAFLTTACSVELNAGSSDPGPGTSSRRAFFFKATGGEHHQILPLAGVKLYDNNTYAHIFKRECDDEKTGAVKQVSTTSSGKSAQEQSRIGGIAESKALCGYDAAFFFENEKLIVRNGDLGFGKKWPTDVEYTEISQGEFVRELKAQTQDKGFNYRTLPRDEREEFDEACKDLTGKICSDLF